MGTIYGREMDKMLILESQTRTYYERYRRLIQNAGIKDDKSVPC